MSADRELGVALIGTGRVAQALCERIDWLKRQGALSPLVLRGIANSRGQWRVAGGSWAEALAEAEAWSRRLSDRTRIPETGRDWDILIDTSDAEAVAGLHSEWLAAGRVVVTANKRGLGGPCERAARILALCRRGARYGASATVGAGLGAIDRLSRMRAQGERVLAIEGVLSGTLAFVLDRVSEGEALGEAVAAAQALGLAEPDPVEDLAGRDAARKLQILARVGALAGAGAEVSVDPLLDWPEGASSRDAVPALADRLSRHLAARPSARARLAAVARAQPGRLSLSLEWLHTIDPLAQRHGPENVVLIRSERYREHPMLLRGPGAGAGLTAMALIDDLLASLEPWAGALAADAAAATFARA
jgi:homoserine dehydrogenase